MKFRAAVILIFVVLQTSIVLAHGGEPRLEITPERVNPGMTVDVRGVDFPPEEPAALTLNGAGRTLDLGSVTPDVEGVFTYVFAVPADLPEGSYVLSAAVSDHTVFSPPFTVSGQPVTGEEGGERRGQEEPILAPLPDVPQATPVPSLETDRATQDLAPRVNTATTAAAGVIIISLVFIVLGSMWMRRSR